MERLPKEPPKIDWDFYKNNVKACHIPWVEEIKSKYQCCLIPYPKNTLKEKFEEQEEEFKVCTTDYKQMFHFIHFIQLID